MKYGNKIKRIHAKTFTIKAHSKIYCHLQRFLVHEEEVFKIVKEMEEYMPEGVSVFQYTSKNFMASGHGRTSTNIKVYSTPKT